MKKRTRLSVLGIASLVLLLFAQPAAADDPPGPPDSVVIKGGSEVKLLPPQVEGGPPVLVKTSWGDARRAAPGTPGPQARRQGRSLAASTYTTWVRDWRQWMESLLWGIAWREEHRGSYYFNGTYVWENWHRCGYNSGIGFSISVISCWRTGNWSTWRMSNGDQFRVSVIYHGFPIYATHEMRVCMGPGGGFWGC